MIEFSKSFLHSIPYYTVATEEYILYLNHEILC